jgi:hypothetical protein
VKQVLPGLRVAGGIAGTLVTATFLLVIATVNTLTCTKIWQAWRRALRDDANDDHRVDADAATGGLLSRLTSPLLAIVGRKRLPPNSDSCLVEDLRLQHRDHSSGTQRRKAGILSQLGRQTAVRTVLFHAHREIFHGLFLTSQYGEVTTNETETLSQSMNREFKESSVEQPT